MRSLSILSTVLLSAVVAQAQNDTFWPWQTFRTTDAQPPSLRVTTSGATTPGYLFFDQSGESAHNRSLFIMSEENDLIWQSAYGSYSAYKPQYFRGEPVLVFMNGITFPDPYGFGYGIIQLLDNSYENIYNVSLTADDGNYKAIGGFNASRLYSWIDMHEARITPQDTMLVTLCNVTQHDLSSVGGPENGWVNDALFYEIDIATNEILFSWSALDHTDEIPPSDVLQFYPLGENGRNQSAPWGYFHINSVDKFEDGSYLISSRFFCSVFKIAKDGSVEWTLQGDSGGDFDLGPGVSFCYQHDARVRKETPDGLEISIFDDNNSPVMHGVNEAKGLFMTLDTTEWKASLARKLVDPKDAIYPVSQGNLQLLPDSHALVSYGSTPKMKEFSPNGTVLMTTQFGHGDGNVFTYRGHKAPWVGKPKTPPSVFACSSAANETMVYMSWNGATEHKEWSVFAGNSKDNLHLAGKAQKEGFETVASISGHPDFVRAEATGLGILPGMSDIIVPMENC